MSLTGSPRGVALRASGPSRVHSSSAELFGENDIGGVVGALALQVLGHRHHGRNILELVQGDGDCGAALPNFRHLDCGELAGGYGSGERAGHLVSKEPGT